MPALHNGHQGPSNSKKKKKRPLDFGNFGRQTRILVGVFGSHVLPYLLGGICVFLLSFPLTRLRQRQRTGSVSAGRETRDGRDCWSCVKMGGCPSESICLVLALRPDEKRPPLPWINRFLIDSSIMYFVPGTFAQGQPTRWALGSARELSTLCTIDPSG